MVDSSKVWEWYQLRTACEQSIVCIELVLMHIVCARHFFNSLFDQLLDFNINQFLEHVTFKPSVGSHVQKF